ncbi:T9SS type A sorting domain-containing protein [Ferruginibacter sp.]
MGIKISPNPVISNAIIDYIVPGNGKVIITLVNSFGQQLQILCNASLSAGQYKITLNDKFKSLVKGVYFLKIEQNKLKYYIQFIKQ